MMAKSQRSTTDRQTFKNENLVLRVRPHDPSKWNESRYEGFLDALCGSRDYQKVAIKTTLSYLLGGRYVNLSQLAEENFVESEDIRQRWGRLENLQKHLQLPSQLSASLDLATATGKSFVLYGIAAILLAEGAVDRVLVLCPSNTIEIGLLAKFRELATDTELRDLLPSSAIVTSPRVINASETIVTGSICVENYHAVLDHVRSSIKDSLKGNGARVAVLNDEAHHVANASGSTPGKWKDFLSSPEYGFKYVIGVSGTCYVGDDYFSDVLFRYSLRQAMEQRFVKKIEYVAEMPATHSREEKWQLVWRRHADWKNKLKRRKIRPLTIVVTQQISACNQVAEELIEWISAWEKISAEEARLKVLIVTSHKDHQINLSTLRSVDSPASKIEWIVSVSMLTEGWDVKNVFQIVPYEERAFNSKLLIAQVLGRGLRRPANWEGEEPVVTVFNHDSWSGRIKHLVDEILEIERRLTSSVVDASPHHFVLHTLNYERVPEVSVHPMKGEYKIFESGYVVLPSQVVNQAVTIEFVRAISGETSRFDTTIKQKTFSQEYVAEQLYQRLKAIDEESASGQEDEKTHYAKHFPLKKCSLVVSESLRRAKITDGLVTDDNRQKFLQALGPLSRKSAKRVVYMPSPKALVLVETRLRPSDSCSAAELRRSSKTIFFTDESKARLIGEQQDFFTEIVEVDGEFAGGVVRVENPADFKTPTNIAIADASGERKFIRELIDRRTTIVIDSWLKNTSVGFYSVEYAWKKGEHTKRGDFSPDFFIKQGNLIFVIEVKDNNEIVDPAPENVKKHEFARAHFELVNAWMKKAALSDVYQFNMLAPQDFSAFFQELRANKLPHFQSELDVAMINAGTTY